MRPNFAIRLGLGCLVFGVLVYGAAAAMRVRLERSEALRDNLIAAVRNELGLVLELTAFELDLLPPRVRLHSAVVGLPADLELHVGRATLNLAPLPLLWGRADVTGIRASGRSTLVGLHAGPGTLSDDGLSADAVLRLERSRDGGWDGEFSGELETGGSFEADGRVEPDGRSSAAVAFERVEMSPLSSLLREGADPRSQLAGVFGGTVEVDVPANPATSDPAKLVLRLESPQSRIRIQDVSVEGPVRIEARTDGLHVADGGSFEVDAGAARVEYAGAMQQASGSGAILRGRVHWSGGKLALEDLRISVKAFRGQVVGPRGSQRESGVGGRESNER